MMITETERRWVEQALEKLYEGEVSPMMSAKIMRTVGQIFEQGAKRIETQLIDTVDSKLARNYQDLQNQKLVDILGQ
jgi:hypothetical protein